MFFVDIRLFVRFLMIATPELIGELWKSGKRFAINNSGISLEGKSITQLQEIALVGMRLDFDTNAIKLGPQPENEHGCLVSWPNRRERLWRAKDAWHRIRSGK